MSHNENTWKNYVAKTREEDPELVRRMELRVEYVLRIQKAMDYTGNGDHEDILSILVEYEQVILNTYPKNKKDLTKRVLQEIEDFVNYETFHKGYELKKILELIQSLKIKYNISSSEDSSNESNS